MGVSWFAELASTYNGYRSATGSGVYNETIISSGLATQATPVGTSGSGIAMNRASTTFKSGGGRGGTKGLQADPAIARLSATTRRMARPRRETSIANPSSGTLTLRWALLAHPVASISGNWQPRGKA